jgi:hypothetical protein
MNSSKAGDIVADFFGGSGSTLIACEKTGRLCHMLEIDPKYVDVIVTRWMQFTGKQAMHELTGTSFEQVKANRAVQASPSNPTEAKAARRLTKRIKSPAYFPNKSNAPPTSFRINPRRREREPGLQTG